MVEQSQGYKCEFKDPVPDELVCKTCALVARRLVITSCCGESFCQTCITDSNNPCPVCGEQNFTTFQQVKNQKRISPHLDNCQYVDTKCPLNCRKTVPKNKVDQHVAQECFKRPHICQHCGFKASYDEVVDTHFAECKYVALKCPNMCGVSCEREVMEDHMKICRLEEVECEFSSVGCDGRFIREDQDEHARQNSQKHLSLTASVAVETKEQLQQKLLEQDKKHKEEEEKLKRNLWEQEKKLGEQEKKLGEQEKKLGEQEKKLGEQEKKLGEQEKKVGEQEKKLGQKQFEIDDLKRGLQKLEGKHGMHNQNISTLLSIELLNRQFEMRSFSVEKARNKASDWKSPAMYTHVCGYKFCIGVDANGFGHGRGNSINIDIFAMPGEFDDQLKWPAKARFTIELINQRGGTNAKCLSGQLEWGRQSCMAHIHSFHRITMGLTKAFIMHSSLSNYLHQDTLYFHLSKVEMF